MRKAAISIMPACLVVALGGLSVTPSVAQVAEPPPDSSFQKVTLEDSPGNWKGNTTPRSNLSGSGFSRQRD
jgi:hypothetical protein